MSETCAKTVELSAYLDEELTARERGRMDAHLAACPICGATLADLRRLRADLKALPQEALGFDLGGVIEGRLAAMPRPARWRRSVWSLVPVGVGAAAAVSLGLAIGSALVAGGGVAAAPRVVAMAVFDPIPPGGLCIGLDSCYGRGR